MLEVDSRFAYVNLDINVSTPKASFKLSLDDWQLSQCQYTW